jgi:hypothetical protein
MKLFVRLLAEMLEVRILPGEPTPLSRSKLRTISVELCPLAMKCQVRELRLISINEDEGKSTRAGVSEVDQINRGQSRSNQAFGSRPNTRAYEANLWCGSC